MAFYKKVNQNLNEDFQDLFTANKQVGVKESRSKIGEAIDKDAVKNLIFQIERGDRAYYRRKNWDLNELKAFVFEQIVNGFVKNKKDLEEYFIDFAEESIDKWSIPDDVDEFDYIDELSEKAGKKLAKDFYYELENERTRDWYIARSGDYYDDEAESKKNISRFLKKIKY